MPLTKQRINKLIFPKTDKPKPAEAPIINARIEDIVPAPYQPRQGFHEKELMELAGSIRTHGILQPLLVRAREQGGYTLIAGERRLRAAKIVGLQNVPCIIIDRDTKTCAEISLIENIQRQDLCFFEEAAAYKRLIEDFSLSQSQIAVRLGKSQSAIANKLRILKLPIAAQMIITNNKLTERHARELLKLPDNNAIYAALEKMVRKKLNVSQTEQLVENMTKNCAEATKKTSVRDMRIFINTINRAVNLIKKAGIKPVTSMSENDGFVEYTIKIPKTS